MQLKPKGQPEIRKEQSFKSLIPQIEKQNNIFSSMFKTYFKTPVKILIGN